MTCEIEDDPNSCTSCIDGYYLDSTSNPPQCIVCPEGTGNCESDVIALNCKPGYYLDG